MSEHGWTPQAFDAVARTLTTALISVILVAAVAWEAVTSGPEAPSYLHMALVGWAGAIVGFYLGGHVAQNTAVLEERRLGRAVDAGEASAVRSEASARRSEQRPDS